MIRPEESRCRADLHVHSKYSDRPSEWVLRRIGAPECFVEPRDIYDRAIAAGMDFVTISDHNKIDGALEIAHLPNTFISNEVTTYFPENDAKMHVLTIGINEEQFAAIQELRTDIYAFAAYLHENNIAYSVAHPLFLVNDRLTLDQFEKLLLLFNRFEVINGTRDPRASQVVEAILQSLTPQAIADLADKHNITPFGPTPHLKMRTAGSDDHSGLYIASAHTTTPYAPNVAQFLQNIRMGRHEPAGKSGNSVHLAHCFYQIAYGYYKNRFAQGGKGVSILGEMLKKLLEPAAPRVSNGSRLRRYVTDFVWRRRKAQMSGTERMIVEEFSQLFGSQRRLAGHPPTAAHAFEISCKLAHQLGFTFTRRMMEKVAEGDLVKSLEAFAAMGPVLAAITPYLAAFKTQHKDERFIKSVVRHLQLPPQLLTGGEKRGWVTDTYDDVNGVARTIQVLADTARREGRPLEVMTCLEQNPAATFPIHNFKPVGLFAVPEYEAQKLAFPPFLEVLEYIERQRYGQLIISTPGPMGLLALAAAKMMHIRTIGIYHTDFPNYVRAYTDDLSMEAMTWRYMSWFFEQCDVILAPSEYYRRYLIEHGFSAEKVGVLQRGVDTERFNPDHRDVRFFERFGGRQAMTFLYVGRMSQEKNLDILFDAFDKVTRRVPGAQLAIVGDGPRLDELKRRARNNHGVVFTGYIEGADLSAAYASADVFVFPSTTDTFGNAVAEAQASGLPAIVSDRGGPQEIVGYEKSGVVLDLSHPLKATDTLASAMSALAEDRDLRQELRRRALRNASNMGWTRVLDHLWNVQPQTPVVTHTQPAVRLQRV